MDSNVLVENFNFRGRVGDVLETSINIVDMGTKNIFKELNKMRENYTVMINKCK